RGVLRREQRDDGLRRSRGARRRDRHQQRMGVVGARRRHDAARRGDQSREPPRRLIAAQPSILGGPSGALSARRSMPSSRASQISRTSRMLGFAAKKKEPSRKQTVPGIFVCSKKNMTLPAMNRNAA